MQLLISTFWLALALVILQPASAQSLGLMSYNLRFDNPADGPDQWLHRRAAVAQLIDFYQPDVLGVQEALHHQLAYLDSALTHYRYVGVGRDDGARRGEYSAIFYHSGRQELLQQGTFWLSDTPDTVSVGWDAALPRVCTYALLRDRATGKQYWALNTHFDHVGQQARTRSASLILARLQALNPDGLPALLLGDLNAEPHHDPIRLLAASLTDAHSASPMRMGPTGTFNAFQCDHPADRRIDYIFLHASLRAQRYAVLSYTYGGRYPSDHFPVWVEAVWE